MPKFCSRRRCHVPSLSSLCWVISIISAIISGFRVSRTYKPEVYRLEYTAHCTEQLQLYITTFSLMQSCKPMQILGGFVIEHFIKSNSEAPEKHLYQEFPGIHFFSLNNLTTGEPLQFCCGLNNTVEIYQIVSPPKKGEGGYSCQVGILGCLSILVIL